MFLSKKKLDPQAAKERSKYDKPLKFDQKAFLWDLSEDEMSHFKLAEGIRKFAADLIKLENNLRKQLESKL